MGDDRNFLYYFGLIGQVSLIMVGNILVMVFFYKFLTRFIGEQVLLLFICIVFAILSAFYQIYKLIFKIWFYFNNIVS